MLNSNNERELVYVVKVDEINELPGYDRVESATVGGWRCIVPKGQFKPGSLGIYFEIDSLVPSTNPAFAFMEKRNYKVKTQKMCKSISQGLLMAPEDFGWILACNENFELMLKDSNGSFHNPDDETRFLTKELGVTYAEAEDNTRKANSEDKYKKMAQRNPKIFKQPWARWIMKHSWGRKVMFFFFGKKKDGRTVWPAWVQKTDEERVQNMPWVLKDKSSWVATEKIDGSSTTFTMKRGKKTIWGQSKNEFFVCSRNVVFDKPNQQCYYDTNIYLEMAEKYDIETVLTSILNQNPNLEWVTIQGETYGAGVQKRDYSIDHHDFAAFNLIDNVHGRWNSSEASLYLTTNYNIPWVPIVNADFVLPDTVDELLEIATGTSALDDGMREGLVLRSQDGTKSFKAVSNEFLLKYHN